MTTEPIRVVIAEDEALIRLDLKEMLEEEGYAVVGEAGDGEQAVSWPSELRPDLVILDIKMPVLDGIAAAEQIAGARIAPVIILTAFSQRELVERARDAGAMAYLVKPFQKNDLVPAIEMARRRFAEMTRPGRRGARPRGAAGDPQAGGAGQGRAEAAAGHDRGRGVPLDPADGDGPAHLDEGAGREHPGRRPGRRGSRRLLTPVRRSTVVSGRMSHSLAGTRLYTPLTLQRSRFHHEATYCRSCVDTARFCCLRSFPAWTRPKFATALAVVSKQEDVLDAIDPNR